MSVAQVFEHRSFVAASAERLLEFHSERNVLRRLTPPPIFVQTLRDERTSLTAGDVEFVLWIGPLPLRWLARHEPGPIPSSFIDRMLRGPLSTWEHQHIFQPVEGGVELVDKVTLRHKPGLPGVMTRILFGRLPLRILFAYRHWRTRRECEGDAAQEG